MSRSLNAASTLHLKGVHPDLIKVVETAIVVSPLSFIVTEGVRTPETHARYLAQGVSRTKNSRHLTGHAVDLAAFNENGKITWAWSYYVRLAEVMKRCALELKIPIVWGGDWKTFKDGVHFELSRNVYK